MTSNIGLSLAIIVVLFPLALTGALGLAGVVLVHELAEVVECWAAADNEFEVLLELAGFF